MAIEHERQVDGQGYRDSQPEVELQHRSAKWHGGGRRHADLSLEAELARTHKIKPAMEATRQRFGEGCIAKNASGGYKTDGQWEPRD